MASWTFPEAQSVELNTPSRVNAFESATKIAARSLSRLLMVDAVGGPLAMNLRSPSKRQLDGSSLSMESG